MEQWKLEPARDHGLTLGKRLQSVHRESGSIPWLVHLSCWSTLNLGFRLFHRLAVEGRNSIPPNGSFVLAANHSSHLDALILASCLPLRLRERLPDCRRGYLLSKTSDSRDVGRLPQRDFPCGEKARYRIPLRISAPVWLRNCALTSSSPKEPDPGTAQ